MQPMNSFDKHTLYPTLPLSNISLSGGQGSVLGMWKQDYIDRTRYNFTEHRHALSAAYVSGLWLTGLHLNNSGGDGIDLAGGIKDISIVNVRASNNYRQGMSILSAENLRVENCIFELTRGTPPESGEWPHTRHTRPRPSETSVFSSLSRVFRVP